MNRVGKIYASIYEAGEAVGVDVSRYDNRSGRADVAGDPHGKRDASILVNDDGRGGSVCNFKSDEYACWIDGYSESWTREEKERRFKEIEANRAKAEERKAIEDREGQFTASMILRECKPVVNHPYLTRKHIKPTNTMFEIDAKVVDSIFAERGIRNESTGQFFKTGLHGRLLVTPLYKGNELKTLQFIDSNGNKQYMKGGNPKGAYWLSRPIEDYYESDLIGIGEGVATVRSVELVERFPCVAVTTCHNFLAVARYFRGRFQNKRIVILSDIGRGEDQAKQASDAIGALPFQPYFTEQDIQAFKTITGKSNPSDWNDYLIATRRL